MATIRKQRLEDLTDIHKEHLSTAHQLLDVIKSASDPKLIYLHCYQLMKLGGLDAEVPRLVVFGQQSMGKTTLLDFIMGGPIGYSSTDTGTRQPVVIIMRPESAIDPRELELASGSVGSPSSTITSKKIWCKFNGKIMDIHNVQQNMRLHMQSLGERICSEELEVEVYVPDAITAIFVDLPGIKDDSKSGAEFTRRVVRNYVSNNPNDLYLLVKKSSDDPANWPWSLREFITAAAPNGLGLSPQQTMVVGTRAREFLINEKTDIRTQDQLYERVHKRAVLDSKGQALPLHLLELFSLSIQAKDKGDFLTNKEEMKRQIANGQVEVENMIRHGFEESNSINKEGRSVSEELLDTFSIRQFLRSLNSKFSQLLNGHLTNLERRLIRKKIDLERIVASLETKLQCFSPTTVRESIKQFIRQFMEIVHNMMMGNYTIMKLPIPPEQFLGIYGGSLRDNLEDGHELAQNLFPQPDMYESNFYTKITARTEELYNKKLTMIDTVKPGRYVRYFTSKISVHMFGLIEPPRRVPPAVSGADLGPFDMMGQDYGADELINVEFIQLNNNEENSLHKDIDRSKLSLLTPLASVSAEHLQVPLYAWHKTKEPKTGWVVVRPIVIDRLPPEILVQKSNYREVDVANKQISFRYLDVEFETKALGSGEEDQLENSVETEISETPPVVEGVQNRCSNRYLYVTACSEIFLEEHRTAPYYASALEMVSGEHAEANLLNQLAVTNICHWLKFQIKHMEPEHVYSAEVLYQMLRSIDHVVDRADWEPLVADLVQSNVRGTLLHASRLAACASAAALRRVLRASLAEAFRCIKLTDCDQTLYCLPDSLHFQEQIDHLSEEYCRQKAIDCANAMMNCIIEQTYSIQFDVAVDIFDGCRQFEKYFMGRAGHRSFMGDALSSVKEDLALRKRRLAMTDIFEKSDAKTSIELIYEEVKVQFWATKLLLSTPLTTKLYTYFIKQVVDKALPTTHSDPTASIKVEFEQLMGPGPPRAIIAYRPTMT
ncbi:bifunctional Dynamin [Babesia duncani]|uniref:Bifunctional Dynamin n=1 Tax=Babesia duncani TaxID=323732 RepID=A0AAD9UNE9_9APIC|nr:bifunctional Dynamin [Babesia duncani]